MDNLLALDINEDYVCGVLLTGGQKASIVRNYGVAQIGEGGVGAAVVEVVHQTEFRQGECRVAIAAGKCSFRNLVLPFRDKQKVEKVLPFELEEVTAFDLEGFQLAYLSSTGTRMEGTEILAAMVEKGRFVEMLAELDAAGIDPEMVGVSGVFTAAALPAMEPEHESFVLLDIGLRQATLVLVDQGRVALVRSLGIDAAKSAGFALSATEGKVLCNRPENIAGIVSQLTLPLEQTLLSIGRSHLLQKGGRCFLSGVVGLYPAFFEEVRRNLEPEVKACNISQRMLLKIEPVEGREWNPALMNGALAAALWKRKDSPVINFRTGVFRKRKSFKDLRKNLLAVALPAVLVAVVLIGYLGWGYSELARQRDVLDQQILEVFRQTLPEVGRVVNPVQQLQVKVDESRKVYGGGQGSGHLRKLALLAELSARIPESLPIRITRLVVDQNDARIMAQTQDFNTVDNVKRELEKSELFGEVVISSANLAPKGGEVRFELRLQLK